MEAKRLVPGPGPRQGLVVVVVVVLVVVLVVINIATRIIIPHTVRTAVLCLWREVCSLWF